MKGIDDSELDKIIYSPVCSLCKHFRVKVEENTCNAFPDGIPDEIWIGKNYHKNRTLGITEYTLSMFKTLI